MWAAMGKTKPERPGRWEADLGGAHVLCSGTLANGGECGPGRGGQRDKHGGCQVEEGSLPQSNREAERGRNWWVLPGRMTGWYLAVWDERRFTGCTLGTGWEVSHSLLGSSGGGTEWGVGHSWDTQVTLEAGGGRSEGRLKLKPDMWSQSRPDDLSRP